MSELDDLEFETIPCPLCGSEEARLLFEGRDRLHHMPGKFDVVRCSRCEHVYVNPRPTLKEIGRFYPDNYGPHQKTESSERASTENDPTEIRQNEIARPWYLSQWVKAIPGLKPFYYWLTDDRSVFIPEEVALPRRALDVGCSHGAFLERLRDRGWEAEGVEFAEAPANTARSRGFQIHHGTLETAEFAEQSFQAVFANMVLEHLHDPQKALREIRRILVERGWLVFTVPNYACWERIAFGKYWHAWELPRHLHHFAPRTLRMLLDETGFSDIKIIHQRNFNQVFGSLGLCLRESGFAKRIGDKLIERTHRPTLAGNLMLAPPAILAALCRQGGRLTIVARKPSSTTGEQSFRERAK